MVPKTSIHHSSFSENDGKENPSKSPFVKCAGGAYFMIEPNPFVELFFSGNDVDLLGHDAKGKSEPTNMLPNGGEKW